MSQQPMTQEDQDNAKEWARISMREYEHYGVPMDLLPASANGPLRFPWSISSRPITEIAL